MFSKTEISAARERTDTVLAERVTWAELLNWGCSASGQQLIPWAEQKDRESHRGVPYVVPCCTCMNVVPSANNLQWGDFGSSVGISECRALANLSSMNISSCFVNPFSMYNLRRGKHRQMKSRSHKTLLPAWPEPSAQGTGFTKPPSSPESESSLTLLLTSHQASFAQSVINF